MQLSQGQQKACEFITDFLLNKHQPHDIYVPRFKGDEDPMIFNSNQVMVLSGAAGTGKTTVIKYVLEHLEKVQKTMEALGIKVQRNPRTEFTATTNKAAEAFEHAMGCTAKTIHSLLRLGMEEDPKTYKDVLVSHKPDELLWNTFVFVDEASYIDMTLLEHIYMKLGKGTKVIFMGDKAQCKTAEGDLPVFEEGRFPMVELTQIMRQADDNPVQALSKRLRQWVLEGGPTPPCNVDGKNIIWVERSKFEAGMIRDMSRDEWEYSTSKFLAFTNKRVNEVNHKIYSQVTGSQILREGDYAICNSYVGGIKNVLPAIGTDRLVYLTGLEPGKQLGEEGHWVYTDRNRKGSKDFKSGEKVQAYFMPNDKKAKDKLLKRYSKKLQGMVFAENPEEFTAIKNALDKVKSTWIDLRPVFGCTIHKAQGSTFRRVYVDLGDLNRCRDIDQLRRLLYVAISRARLQVVLTGDIP